MRIALGEILKMNNIHQLLTSATRAYEQNRLTVAEQKVRNILNVQPDHPEALHLLGTISYQNGNLEDAEECMLRSLELARTNNDVRVKLATLYKESGQLSQALEQFQILSQFNPESPEILYNIGNTLNDLDRQEEAVNFFRQALILRPKFVEAIFNLGNVYNALEQWFEAIGCYKQAIEIKPDLVPAYSNCGFCYIKVGQIREAFECYQTAVSLAPNDTWNYVNLANAQRGIGLLDEAKLSFGTAIEQDPDFTLAHLNLHACLYGEDEEKASRCLEQVLRIEPNHQRANFYLGTIREFQGRADSAKNHFQIARKGNPKIDFLIDSWDYVRSVESSTYRLLGTNREMWEWALENANVDGLILEFGVRFGTSIRQIAEITDQIIHGFDLFEGLPEEWGDIPKGAYTTRGVIPDVPDNVELHVGLFENLLPQFVESNPAPIKFMNVDCDLYTATTTIFDNLAGQIVPGTVIIFDEYFANPTWREDEFKAFQEAVQSNGWSYDYLAFSLPTRQVSVKIR